MTRVNGSGQREVAGHHGGDEAHAWSIRGRDGAVGRPSGDAGRVRGGVIHHQDDFGDGHRAHSHAHAHAARRPVLTASAERWLQETNGIYGAEHRVARLAGNGQRMLEQLQSIPVTGRSAAAQEQLLRRAAVPVNLTRTIEEQHGESAREGLELVATEAAGPAISAGGEHVAEGLEHATGTGARIARHVAGNAGTYYAEANVARDGANGGAGAAFASQGRTAVELTAEAALGAPGAVGTAGVNVQFTATANQLRQGDERVEVAQLQSHQEQMVNEVRERARAETLDGRAAAESISFESDQLPSFVDQERVARSPEYRNALIAGLRQRLANDDLH